jgi:nucleoid-associated protein YgaU
VIGILLSDHLTSSTEPPQATIAVVGNNVRSGVSTPGSTNTPPITTPVAPAPVTPQTTVPTQSDLAPRAQPVQPVQVAVGGPSAPQSNTPQIQVRPPVAPAPEQTFVRNDPPVDAVNTTAVTDTAPIISKAAPVAPQTAQNEQQNQTGQANSTDIATALREAARQRGEDLVAIDSRSPSASPASSKQAPAGTKPYVAVDGDSLSRIAAKFFGTNTKSAREAICNVNPSLKQNPNVVVVGKTYYIPPPLSTATTPAAVVQTPAPAPAPAAAPVAQAPAAPSTDNWYTIKDGDTLTKIAMEQCGSAGMVQSIVDLNKETLKDPNHVVVNTKIRLPNKVASAN